MGQEFEDLVQEGYAWLAEHAKDYNPETGVKFSTWVYGCITNQFRRIASYASIRYTEAITDTVTQGMKTVPTMFSITDLSEDAGYVVSLVLGGAFTRLYKKEIRTYLYQQGWMVERVNETMKEIENYVNSL